MLKKRKRKKSDWEALVAGGPRACSSVGSMAWTHSRQIGFAITRAAKPSKSPCFWMEWDKQRKDL
jgi:hypothetical protein